MDEKLICDFHKKYRKTHENNLSPARASLPAPHFLRKFPKKKQIRWHISHVSIFKIRRGFCDQTYCYCYHRFSRCVSAGKRPGWRRCHLSHLWSGSLADWIGCGDWRICQDEAEGQLTIDAREGESCWFIQKAPARFLKQAVLSLFWTDGTQNYPEGSNPFSRTSSSRIRSKKSFASVS